MNENKIKEVPAEKLRWRCDPQIFPVQDFSQWEPGNGVASQKRALDAFRMGLEVKSLGYNIFVTGVVGSGRIATIKRLLEEIKKEASGERPSDICYVNNFRNPDNPRVLILPAGQGKALAKDMDDMVSALKQNIPMIFEREDYQKKRREIVERFQERQRTLYTAFEKKVRERNFALIKVQMGPFTRPDIVPMIAGNPMDLAQLETLTHEGKFNQDEFQRLKKDYNELAVDLEALFKETRKLEKEIQEEFKELDRTVIKPLVKDTVDDVREKYEHQKVRDYLDEAEKNILEHIDRFREKTETQQALPLPVPQAQAIDGFTEFKINVLVDHSEVQGVPIIVETSPSYRNIFGTIERTMEMPGIWRTDFMGIKAGSFLMASGGYLILDAMETLMEPGVWIALKRALKHREVQMQNYDPFYLFSSSAMKPEAIEIQVKVVLVGNEYIYRLLSMYDEDFKKVFKLKADFDPVMDNNEKHIQEYARFARQVYEEEKIRPPDNTALAALAEFGVREAGRQQKLSTRFNRIEDILVEADYWAAEDKSPTIKAEHIARAINEKVYRVNLIEEKLQELITEGILLIDTEGKKVGQVNGLAVYDLGDHRFGKPSRITAKTAMGRGGIINIEREADLSGKTHDKGMLILAGYLRGKYAQDKPLSLSASLCFEQSYSGVDGDSASSTEVYALLSSLSDLPLRQDLAVTGSINQNGDIQAIGGVNEKIEGFFDVCRVRGLTGSQGVIIPQSNVGDLMLRPDVVQAVQASKFHIYPVTSVEEGIEILTGIPAGASDAQGKYPEGCVNFMVNKKLEDLALKLDQFGKNDEEDKKSPRAKKKKPG